jgi:hypothetical protein
LALAEKNTPRAAICGIFVAMQQANRGRLNISLA